MSQVILPAVLSLMMFTMGLALTADDFRLVLKKPKGFALGAFNQLIVLPLFAFILVQLFGLESELAIGVMILAGCPGGVVSNAICYFSRADLALSVSLTSIVSFIALLTLPILVAFSMSYFGDGNALQSFPYLQLARTLLLVTVIPVLLGMLLRYLKPTLALAIQPGMDKLSGLLFMFVVLVTIIGRWNDLSNYVASLGMLLLSLGALLLLWGLLSAQLFGLELRSRASIAFETSIQNVATAMVIGGTVLGNDYYMIPAAIYGVLMFVPAAALMAYMRSKISSQAIASR